MRRPWKSAAPLQFLILLVAGWIGRRQGKAIEYLRAENRVLRPGSGTSIFASPMPSDGCSPLAAARAAFATGRWR